MPDADHDPFEKRLADVLRDTGTEFGTDQQMLAARGETHGRRLRSRRRAAVVGGAAAVALVGLGGTLLLPAGQQDAVRQRSAAAAPVARATPGPTHTPAGTAAHVMSGEELLRTLEKLLPEGRISDNREDGTDDRPRARVVYDDGGGKAAVAVTLNRVKPGSVEARQAAQCPDTMFIVYDTCTSTKLSDGSVLMLLKRYESPKSHSDRKLWSAELMTPAGGYVGVQEWNSTGEPSSPATRAQPPLDLDRLKALATAPELRAAADAMPVDARSAAEPDTGPVTPGGSVSATLSRLVPHGIKIVRKSGPHDDDFGYVVLDDGRGASLVQVNVQPDMRDVEKQLFGPDAKVLPDGTKVATHQQPGEKGVPGIVWWSVDTIRPDGRRVVISAFNSGTQESPATRKTPVLTMKQLEAIATDPKWHPQD
ncbi:MULTISPECIES: hypothetical protein [unclassified Streptomyces]|uniref:hypothetical protein n=1 Tax=unclassified Streptomyces TaxID=2593676 RepID=UPI0034037D7D